MSHFADRWNERGRPDLEDGKALCERLQRAIIANDTSVVDRVMKDPDTGITIYRFIIGGERFYAPADKTGWPRTVFDHDMLRRKKRARKFLKSGKPSFCETILASSKRQKTEPRRSRQSERAKLKEFTG